MDFGLTDLATSWQRRGDTLGVDLARSAAAGDVVAAAVRAGLFDPHADLLASVAAVEALARHSASAAVTCALHAVVLHALHDDGRWVGPLAAGEVVGAMALSADEIPTETSGRLNGVASWVAPLTASGVAVVGADAGEALHAFVLPLDARGVTIRIEEPSGLRGLSCARVQLQAVEVRRLGPTMPVMARGRVLMAAVGLGIGARALAEALAAARDGDGAGAGEQTVRGLLADAATELDAARLLTWQAALAGDGMSLGTASVAKLAATEAAQRAVARASQVVGIDAFRHDHIVEQLARDVRALELFAGRTEALRAAVAAEILPAENQPG